MRMPKTKTPPENFRDRVLAIVRRIPRGKVLTYGQVAILAGVPRAARMVGGILCQMGPGSRVPWQRVLNAQGGLSTYRVGFGEKQKTLLKQEGLRFNRKGHVALKRYQWFPRERTLEKLGVWGNLHDGGSH